jgi:hypothetical protein
MLFPVGFNEQIDRSRCIVFKLGFIGCRIQPTITSSRSVFIAACLSLELTRREALGEASDLVNDIRAISARVE